MLKKMYFTTPYYPTPAMPIIEFLVLGYKSLLTLHVRYFPAKPFALSARKWFEIIYQFLFVQADRFLQTLIFLHLIL